MAIRRKLKEMFAYIKSDLSFWSLFDFILANMSNKKLAYIKQNAITLKMFLSLCFKKNLTAVKKVFEQFFASRGAIQIIRDTFSAYFRPPPPPLSDIGWHWCWPRPLPGVTWNFFYEKVKLYSKK